MGVGFGFILLFFVVSVWFILWVFVCDSGGRGIRCFREVG